MTTELREGGPVAPEGASGPPSPGCSDPLDGAADQVDRAGCPPSTPLRKFVRLGVLIKRHVVESVTITVQLVQATIPELTF